MNSFVFEHRQNLVDSSYLSSSDLEADEAGRWALAQKLSGDYLWDWDLTRNQITHNQTWAWLDSSIAKGSNTRSHSTFLALIHPEDRGDVEDALNQLIAGTSSYDKIFRLCPPDIEPVWVWDRGIVAEYDAQNQPTRIVGAMREVSDIIAYQTEVERLAYFDSLTKLPNRDRLEDRLQQAIKHFQVSGEYVAVLFLDLDKFKYVNDTHGHHLGDSLLVEVASRVSQLMGPEDTLARFAGDEFVAVVMTGLTDKVAALHYAEIQAEKIHRATQLPMSFQQPQLATQVQFTVTTSIGIALCESADQSVDELLRLADLALYRAKEKGRNCNVIFNPDMQSELERFVEIENALKHALANDEFVAFFQPKVNVNGKVNGAEMLVRWHKPNGEIVPPSEFLQIAEETSLIMQIGCWMLRQALEQLQSWQTQPAFKDLTLAVNISAKQLQLRHFGNTVLSMIQAAKIAPEKLTIEITETVVMTNIDMAIEQLSLLREFGVNVAIDDFGTGYSSLGYLKRLPVNKLKIDRSFVNDVLHNQNDAMLIKTIINIGENFNLSVVAEGVESSEQLAKLSEFGCQHFQGFYFSRPVGLVEFEQWVLQHRFHA